ncbi:MAG: Gfo/Idh/MocA family protein [Rhodopirellula sp. JB055]|uniref:Gfo/Idh/MocA family protein n=1 Tax=Rhodopirellula sp. JB055 TaxID=3342846 RepID=UPI00370AD6B9
MTHGESDAADLSIDPIMPKNRNVPIGCIGAGFIMDDCHLVAYRAAGFHPVAIASRRREQADKVAERHGITHVFDNPSELLADTSIEVVDIAVPPDNQLEIIREVVRHPHIRGILVQKPIAGCFAEAKQIVDLCRDAGITLCVNQNMRYDQSVRACKTLLDQGHLGEPVLATVDMRAIPHWMPWQQRQGWMTCRIMSIHHLDAMRYWFGDPVRIFASFRTDPRTTFPHVDGIGLYILEYANGLRCQICDDVWAGPAREGAAEDLGITWRVEGTKGMARGTIGWPKYPLRNPSTIDWTTTDIGRWEQPRWDQVWFPDAFAGPMAELLVALETGVEPNLSGRDNLRTMALVDACYESAETHRAIELPTTL